MKTITTTAESRTTFRQAIFDVLTTDRETWPNPVIYAVYIGNDKYSFGACNASALGGHEIVWIYVEPDTFGGLTGDAEADALGIETNMFEDAVNDCSDANVY
jgi:hypothetical protein